MVNVRYSIISVAVVLIITSGLYSFLLKPTMSTAVGGKNKKPRFVELSSKFSREVLPSAGSDGASTPTLERRLNQFFPAARSPPRGAPPTSGDLVSRLIALRVQRNANYSTMKDFCRDPRNCLTAKCYAPWDRLEGGCEPNPYFRYTPPPPQTTADEYTCPGRKDERHLLENNNNSTNDDGDRLFKFKQYTSWMFRKWYNWSGQCVKPASAPAWWKKKFTSAAQTQTSTAVKTDSADANDGNNNKDQKQNDVDDEDNKSNPVVSSDGKRKKEVERERKRRKAMQQKNVSGDDDKNEKKEEEAEEQQEEEEGRMRGFHDMKNTTLYRLQNFCFRPNGQLVGYKPHMERYYGTDDIFWIRCGAYSQSVSSNIFGRVRPLRRPPKCFLDTKLVIYPATLRQDSMGHVFYRVGSLLRTIEAAYGTAAMEQKTDVTIAYIAASSGKISFESREHLEHLHAQRNFYDILGTSWFSVFGDNWHRRENSTTAPPRTSYNSRKGASSASPRRMPRNPFRLSPQRLREIYGFDPDPVEFDDNDDNLACFREAYVWQNGHENVMKCSQNVNGDGTDEVRRGASNPRIPGHQTSFHLFGPRSPRDVETLKILDERLRQCRDLPPRRKRIRRKNPSVMLVVRGKYRRLLFSAYATSYVAKMLPTLPGFGEENNFDLQVVETGQLTWENTIRIFTDTDIIISGYGGALTWQIFLPPQSIIVELSTPGFRYAHHAGINLDSNRGGEWLGGAAITGQYHIAMPDPNVLARYTYGAGAPGAFDNSCAHPVFQLALEKVSCLLQFAIDGQEFNNTVSSTKGQAMVMQNPKLAMMKMLLPVPRLCQFDNRRLAAANAAQESNPLWPEVVARYAALRLFPKKNKEQQQQQRQESADYDNASSANAKTKQDNDLLLVEPDFHSNRLVSIIANSRVAADALAAVRRRLRRSNRGMSLLIIEPCKARAQVVAEIAALRFMLQLVNEVTVAEFANCYYQDGVAGNNDRNNDNKRGAGSHQKDVVVDGGFSEHHHGGDATKNKNDDENESRAGGNTRVMTLKQRMEQREKTQQQQQQQQSQNNNNKATTASKAQQQRQKNRQQLSSSFSTQSAKSAADLDRWTRMIQPLMEHVTFAPPRVCRYPCVGSASNFDLVFHDCSASSSSSLKSDRSATGGGDGGASSSCDKSSSASNRVEGLFSCSAESEARDALKRFGIQQNRFGTVMSFCGEKKLLVINDFRAGEHQHGDVGGARSFEDW